VRTRLTPTRGGAWGDVEQVFGELEVEARRELEGEGIAASRISVARSLGMRYVGQSWELVVKVPVLPAGAEGAAAMAAVEGAFREAHQRRYGHARDAAAEIVNFRLTAVGEIDKPGFVEMESSVEPASAVAAARRGERDVLFGQSRLATPVYQRERLPAGAGWSGPAIVEEMGATTVVPPGWSASVGAWGELRLARRGL
jgi:N-methylhydantoinase A